MANEIIGKEKNHIQFYDNKADIIWQNIAKGNNVLIVNDEENKSSYSYLLSSFANLIHKPDKKYGNLDPEKTHIVELNDKANYIFLDNLIYNLKQFC